MDLINRIIYRKSIWMPVIAVFLLSSVICISAYFTSTASADNTFVLGNVTVQLDEPGWDEEKAADIFPETLLVKDPVVTNTGTNDAYIFAEIGIPKKNIFLYDSSGSKTDRDFYRLFQLNNSEHINRSYVTGAGSADTGVNTVNSGWTLIDTDFSGEDYDFYDYVYGSETECTILPAPDGDDKDNCSTPPIFSSIAFCPALEGQGLDSSLRVSVSVYGIQTGGLSDDSEEISDSIRPVSIFHMLKNGE